MKKHLIEEFPQVNYRRLADIMQDTPMFDIDKNMEESKEPTDNSFQPPLSIYLGPSRGETPFRLEVYDANGDTLVEFDDYTKTRKKFEFDVGSYKELMDLYDKVRRDLQAYGPAGEDIQLDDPAGFTRQAGSRTP
jgi:hypothetical protein